MTSGDPTNPNDPNGPGYTPPGGHTPPPGYGSQPPGGGYGTQPTGGYGPPAGGGYGAQPAGGFGGYPAAPPPGPGQASSKGFFSALFDFGFNSFVTPALVKVVYILGTIVLAIGVIFFIIAGFVESIGAGIAALILAPIIGLIYLAFLRVTLELYYAVVRLSEDVHHRGNGRL
ncbi:DUF4282 domain-containing protein [Gordonia sp. DT218]|uniref:DUF4282 domain-containing protein n=1 Tax=unclassified Gordonia (in: high G+C Gram-positive bacteria) TaxID=2657482 RepID=UPI003CF4A027